MSARQSKVDRCEKLLGQLSDCVFWHDQAALRYEDGITYSNNLLERFAYKKMAEEHRAQSARITSVVEALRFEI